MHDPSKFSQPLLPLHLSFHPTLDRGGEDSRFLALFIVLEMTGLGNPKCWGILVYSWKTEETKGITRIYLALLGFIAKSTKRIDVVIARTQLHHQPAVADGAVGYRAALSRCQSAAGRTQLPTGEPRFGLKISQDALRNESLRSFIASPPTL